MKALISVYDKTGVLEFARALKAMGFELVSTGGTYKTLSEKGELPVQQVSDLTAFPEILDGRVKTLHPAIHGGILARRERPEHLAQLQQHSVATIDLVAVNLYPFAETISRPKVTLDEALENIDIGGPTLIRAAAKNFRDVIVIVDPDDYHRVAKGIEDGGLGLAQRRGLAQKAFQHVALYDTLIAHYLKSQEDGFTAELTLGYRKRYDLRYGENPHQRAAFYSEVLASAGLAGVKQLHGKELSFNNILDADAAWRAVSDFEDMAAVVIKHTNPCGLAVHPQQAEAYRRAFEGDTVSAYGGIVGFNRPLIAETAAAMRKVFYEVVVAPGYEPEALEVLKRKKNLRILEVPLSGAALLPELDMRRVTGGVLVQTRDALSEDTSSWQPVTGRQPTPEELVEMAFAWRVAKHLKSNAIVLSKDRALIGMGAGQPNRVTSVHLALRTAGEKAQGSVLASDAFFPFPDGVELAAQGGVKAVVQPGGSIRDQEVIEAANRFNMTMVFTGVRHFRH